MIYVIADDLTGANDTGVQFAKNGYNTMVLIFNKQLKIIIPDNLDVFVMDTETRELESKIAREKLRNILKKLNINKKDMIYKKIDSTLRGNIGVEIEEIMNILKKDICIFSPSFPSHKRITIGGYLVVDQKLLESSEYSSNNLKQEKNSFIPFLFKKQTNFSVGQIDLKDVAKGQKAILSKINDLYQKGNKIIVIDSTSEQHLEDIFSSSLKFDGSVLFSGSAGVFAFSSDACGSFSLVSTAFSSASSSSIAFLSALIFSSISSISFFILFASVKFDKYFTSPDFNFTMGPSIESQGVKAAALPGLSTFNCVPMATKS